MNVVEIVTNLLSNVLHLRLHQNRHKLCQSATIGRFPTKNLALHISQAHTSLVQGEVGTENCEEESELLVGKTPVSDGAVERLNVTDVAELRLVHLHVSVDSSILWVPWSS